MAGDQIQRDVICWEFSEKNQFDFSLFQKNDAYLTTERNYYFASSLANGTKFTGGGAAEFARENLFKPKMAKILFKGIWYRRG